jgi:hypothetical protein
VPPNSSGCSAAAMCLQDFFQLLRPWLDILRPGRPAKGAKGPGLQDVKADSFREQYGIEPHQVTCRAVEATSRLLMLRSFC